MTDIVSEAAEIVLGRGWYPVESYGGVRFRWARSEAELLVSAIKPAQYSLAMTVEPGPGVGLRPFDLRVLDGDTVVTSLKVTGNQKVRVDLPANGPKIHRIVLHAENGGKAAPNDPRRLDFRVFDIAVERGPRDVFPSSVRLGKGWYPLEQHAGETFRWVSNDAEIALPNPSGETHLNFDVESGPGLDQKPFTLTVNQRSGGSLTPVTEVKVQGRTVVSVPVPVGERVELVMHTDTVARKSGSDPRTLSFRVFETHGAFAP